MRKNDFWLILVLAVLALGSWFLFHSRTADRDKVLVVRKDQQVIQRIELKKVTSETKLIIPVDHGELVVAYDREGGQVVSRSASARAKSPGPARPSPAYRKKSC